MNIIHNLENWEFTIDDESSGTSFLPENLFKTKRWFEAQVPGTVHTDLLTHGLIEDPFYRDNELKVQWVDKVNWIYRSQFELDEKFLDFNAIHLVAEGLDTIADIFVNEQEVGHTENMFVTHRIDVKSALQLGINEIKLVFHSPTLIAKLLEEKHGKLCHTHESHRMYMRKAQYSFGWDWGPMLPTSGIWKPIYLEAFDSAKIEGIYIQTAITESAEKAAVTVQIEFDKLDVKENNLAAKIKIGDVEKEIEVSSIYETVTFDIKKPELWWPAGLGDQKMYEADVQLFADRKLQHSKKVRFAIRKIELIQEEDEAGKTFLIKINDVPVFCKGANWIPADNFVPRISSEKYRTLLQMAKNANMNIIRVWGGGIYEQDVFYDLCDEMGLLVWQDFMFACGGYPEYDQYKKAVAEEVDFVIKRLRNHPCIALWCGNNENEWIWYRSTGISYHDMPGLSLFHELIPEKCKALDPTRPYWPSTPFGGDDPNSMSTGNRHQWNIWSHWQDPETVKNDRGRFISEFGFQGPANVSTFEAVTLLEDRDPQSEIMEFHNKQIEGPERIYRFLAGHVQMPNSFEDYIYKGQLVQGEALKTCLEHWRRNKFFTAGSIIWQINDCWPVTSWSLIDSSSKPKAAYFYVKRAFQPIAVSFTKQGSCIETWVVNDKLQQLEMNLKIRILNFSGEPIFEDFINVEIKSNSSIKLYELDMQGRGVDESSTYVNAELWHDDQIISENRYFFKRFKHLYFRKSTIKKSVKRLSENRYELKLLSNTFLKSVRIDSDKKLELDENYIDLDAHEERKIEMLLLEKATLTADDIYVRALI